MVMVTGLAGRVQNASPSPELAPGGRAVQRDRGIRVQAPDHAWLVDGPTSRLPVL